MLKNILTRFGGAALVLIVLAVAFAGVAGTIGSGNVGVRTTLGVISPDEVTPGVYVKWPFISTVREFTAKEIAINTPLPP